MRYLKKITILFSVFVALGFVLPQFAFGIGMMTEPIIMENVLRGQKVTDIVYLINPEDKETVFQLTDGGEIAGWATFYKIDDENLENPITEIAVPPKSKIKTTVKFQVPQDAPNGNYAGVIAVMTKPPEQEASQENNVNVNILQRIDREVSITVTDKEIIDFDTAIIPKKYDVQTGKPLQIKIIYDNKGNVSIKPDIQLKIIKDENAIFNAIFPYPENENPIKPFERKEFPNLIEWQTTGQKGGTYKAEITVLLNNQIIKQESFRFTIGYKTNLFLAAISRIGNGDLVTGWFVSAGFLLMITVILITINKKRSSLKKICHSEER